MRNISRLNQALQLLNGGGSPRQIQSAIDKIDLDQRYLPGGTNVRELQNQQMLRERLDDERLMEEIADPWTGSYTTRDADAFEDMAERTLMDQVGVPSLNSNNRKVSMNTPAAELTPRELKAQQATRKIIDDKLMMLGLGALASGSTAAVINNSQGDDRDANVIVNPVTGTVVGTGIAAGLGGLTGYHLSNAPSREMAVDMAKDRKRGSGSGYERDAAFEKNYGKKYNRKVKERAVRGGLRGASVAAGGVALLQILDAMKNDGSSAVIY
ncbi:hypothetical protein SynSYN20_00806 [Synechococcus sp. SYN20]|uniref:hypothetical protein n=1 Tax=Synechococcus sp. SYN20 TaxID=1050714 RepID=UPI001647F0FA|nr:hypothetical protein [Synechococcus sp. SYN20]QNJ25148.1 hypothetical protein SynSYN20_00806 [Synechococcus sp. SYN20]